jgi:hypothetical protein
LRTGGAGKRALKARNIQKNNGHKVIKKIKSGVKNPPSFFSRYSLIEPARDIELRTAEYASMNTTLAFCPVLKTAFPEAIFR